MPARLMLVPLVIVLGLLPAPASAAPETACVAALTDRCHAWAATYDGPASGPDMAEAAALAPDGRLLFVGGSRTVGSGPTSTDGDFAVVAYDASSGERRWVNGYNGIGSGSGNSFDSLLELVTDGERVYGAGMTDGSGENDYDFLTVAFDAASGQRRWVARATGSGAGWDQIEDLALGGWTDPDGTRHEVVLAAGWSDTGTFAKSGLAVAYDAATGQELWRAALEADEVRAVSFTEAPDPEGGTVGLVHVSGTRLSTTTIDAATGETVWSHRFDEGDGGYAWSSVAAEGRVFVTGFLYFLDLNVGATRTELTTVARDAATGSLLWRKSYDDTDGDPYPERITTDGDRVYVAGHVPNGRSGSNALTIAYDAASGAQRWVGEDEGLAGRGLSGWDVAAAGGLVFTAAYYPFTVTARDAVTGARRWTARYTPPGLFDGAYALAVSPDVSRVYAAGGSSPTGVAATSDIITAAWDV